MELRPAGFVVEPVLSRRFRAEAQPFRQVRFHRGGRVVVAAADRELQILAQEGAQIAAGPPVEGHVGAEFDLELAPQLAFVAELEDDLGGTVLHG